MAITFKLADKIRKPSTKNPTPGPRALELDDDGKIVSLKSEPNHMVKP